jgi:hypothetical protein
MSMVDLSFPVGVPLTIGARSVSVAHPSVLTKDAFSAVLQKGLDDVFKRRWEMPMQGEEHFRVRNTDHQTFKFQSHFGMGLVAQNRDVDTLPYDEKGLGFGYGITTNVFRGGIAVERELQELELYGSINDKQQELLRSATDTVELIMADVFNRGLGTSGAPFVCEDGMYFIDDGRPNAYAPAGTWSNLETTSAITPTSLYQATLNFAYNRDERAKLSPLTLRKIIVRPADEKTIWEILKSDLRPTDAMNAANFFKGRFEYAVYNHLTSQYIYYLAGDPKSADNELQFMWRVRPAIETWNDGPDIVRQRVRFAMGLGCGRPWIWRAGAVS